MLKNLSALNPVQLEALRQLVLIGKVPRLMTLSRLVQLGFCEPGTFQIMPGVRMAVLGKPAPRVLDPNQMMRAMRARRDPYTV